MLAEVPKTKPFLFTGASIDATTEDGATINAKIIRDSTGPMAEFYVEWCNDRNGEGGTHYGLIDHRNIEHWRSLVEFLKIKREGIDWLAALRPYKEAFAPDLPPLTQAANKIQLRTLEELRNRPPLCWVVNEYMPMGGLIVLYGPSGSSKSFIALDLALSIASHRPWMGQEVMTGPAVYIAAEGIGGLQQRVDAWQTAHPDCNPGNFRYIEQAVNLLDEQQVAGLLTALLEMDTLPAFLVVDTLARCLVGGDENSARDMGLAIAAIDRIREATGATVLVVHHTGKNGESERGSGALRGAADTMILTSADGNVVKLTCDKMKDADEFPRMYMTRVNLEDSCFMAPAQMSVNGELTKSARAVLTELTDTFTDTGATPAQIVRATGMEERTVYRSLKSLVGSGLVRTEGSGRGVRYYGKKSQ